MIFFPKYCDFVNSDNCTGKISSISIKNFLFQKRTFFEILIFETMKIHLLGKDLIYVAFFSRFFNSLQGFSNFVFSNVCITEIYQTKSNFPSNAILSLIKKKTNNRSIPVKELLNSATLYQFNSISPHQYGFRNGRSAEKAVSTITEILKVQISEKNEIPCMSQKQKVLILSKQLCIQSDREGKFSLPV